MTREQLANFVIKCFRNMAEVPDQFLRYAEDCVSDGRVNHLNQMISDAEFYIQQMHTRIRNAEFWIESLRRDIKDDLEELVSGRSGT